MTPDRSEALLLLGLNTEILYKLICKNFPDCFVTLHIFDSKISYAVNNPNTTVKGNYCIDIEASKKNELVFSGHYTIRSLLLNLDKIGEKVPYDVNKRELILCQSCKSWM